MNGRLFPLFCLAACLVSAACPSGPSASGPSEAVALERKIEFMSGITGRRDLAARALEDVNAALPSGVWLTEAVYDSEAIRLKGRAASNNLLADYVSNLGAIPSLNGVELQSSVQRPARNREYEEFMIQVLVRKAGASVSSEPEAKPGSGDVAALAARLEELEKVLPPRKETADLLRQFQQAAGEAGLKITKFAPGAEAPGDLYNEWPVAIEVAGSRQGFEQFLKGLADWPRLWLAKKFSFQAVSNDDARSPVRVSLTAQTFLARGTEPSRARR
ncbi:MAG TPA: type 4a pilus biogenesis protein PilO [Burkholderiales bacterium]|nr:type 4a pilus biogenesis protein PilO [Burkholderiales bacterium]